MNIDPNDIEDCQKQVADLEAEVRELRAALENKTLDHASALSRQADLLLRAERAEAALADKQRVCDGLVAAIENNQEIDEEHCRELDAARAALEQLQDALSVRDHQYLAAWGQLVASRAAPERARALWIRWRDTICLFPQLEKFVEAADAALGSGGAA